MALDVCRARSATGFHDVGVQRPLDQKIDTATRSRFLDDLAGGIFEHPDELAPDDLSLRLGLLDALERVQEALPRIHGHQPNVGGSDKIALHLLNLSCSQQAMINEDARQLLSDGSLHESGGDGRVDSPRQATDNSRVPHLITNSRNLLVDDPRHRPSWLTLGDLPQEVLEDALPVSGVHDFGMELHSGHSTFDVLESCHRRSGSAGQHVESGRRNVHAVSVRHPDVVRFGQAAQQSPRGANRQRGPAVLAPPGASDRTSETLGHGLESVANPEYRDIQFEDPRIE